MNKIQLCAIQVKYTASTSDRVNGTKCDISVFFTAVLCSVVEFDRSGIEFDQSLEELITHQPISFNLAAPNISTFSHAFINIKVFL